MLIEMLVALSDYIVIVIALGTMDLGLDIISILRRIKYQRQELFGRYRIHHAITTAGLLPTMKVLIMHNVWYGLLTLVATCAYAYYMYEYVLFPWFYERDQLKVEEAVEVTAS